MRRSLKATFEIQKIFFKGGQVINFIIWRFGQKSQKDLTRLVTTFADCLVKEKLSTYEILKKPLWIMWRSLLLSISYWWPCRINELRNINDMPIIWLSIYCFKTHLLIIFDGSNLKNHNEQLFIILLKTSLTLYLYQWIKNWRICEKYKLNASDKLSLWLESFFFI